MLAVRPSEGVRAAGRLGLHGGAGRGRRQPRLPADHELRARALPAAGRGVRDARLRHASECAPLYARVAGCVKDRDADGAAKAAIGSWSQAQTEQADRVSDGPRAVPRRGALAPARGSARFCSRSRARPRGRGGLERLPSSSRRHPPRSRLGATTSPQSLVRSAGTPPRSSVRGRELRRTENRP